MQQNKMSVVSLTFENELCVNYPVDVLQPLIVVQLIILTFTWQLVFFIFLIYVHCNCTLVSAGCDKRSFTFFFQICFRFVHACFCVFPKSVFHIETTFVPSSYGLRASTILKRKDWSIKSLAGKAIFSMSTLTDWTCLRPCILSEERCFLSSSLYGKLIKRSQERTG